MSGHVERIKLGGNMTPEEQQQVNARSQAYEQTILNLAHQDADKAVIIEIMAQQLKSAKEELAELKKPK